MGNVSSDQLMVKNGVLGYILAYFSNTVEQIASEVMYIMHIYVFYKHANFKPSASFFKGQGWPQNILFGTKITFKVPQLPKYFTKHFLFWCVSVRDGAISSKFSTHMVSEQYTLPNFQKFFLCPKIEAILNFGFFAKNAKAQKCFYLLNR